MKRPFDESKLVGYLQEHTTMSDVAERYGADGYGPSLYIYDPDGNIVELKSPPL